MFNFPDIPAVGQIYNPENGPSWKWNGIGWESLAVSTPPFPVVAGVKLILQATTSFYFAPSTGSDTTGDGSLVNPFKTVVGTLAYIEKNIDTNHQQILIVWKTVDGLADPGILRDSLDINKRLLNQDGTPSTLFIRGHINPASIEDLKQYIWSPPREAGAISLSNHAAAHVKGFWFDQKESFNAATAESDKLTLVERQAEGIAACRTSIASGGGTLLYLEDCGFGFNPVGYVSTQHNGFTQWLGNFWCEADNVALTTTTVEAGNNKIYYTIVDETEIAMHVLMGVSGSTIPETAYIVSIDSDGNGNFIIISEYPTGTTLEEVLTLSSYTSKPFNVGQNSFLMHQSDDAKGGGVTWIKKQPHFLYGFIFADENSHAQWGSIFMNPDTMVSHLGIGVKGEYKITLDSAGGIEENFFAHQEQIPIGARVLSVIGGDAGGEVTLDKPLAEELANVDVVFGAMPDVLGYKFTVNLNSSIRPPGPNDITLVPGAMPYYGNVGGNQGTIANGSTIQDMPIDRDGGIRWSGYVAGIRYDGAYTKLDAVGTQLLNDSKIYFVPFRIRETKIFNKIGFMVSGAGSAGQLRMGVYGARLNVPGHPPYDLIFEAGIVDITASGVKEITISSELAAGEYWLGLQVDGEVTLLANASDEGVRKFGSTLDPGIPADLLFSQAYMFSNGLPLVGTITTREVGTFPNIYIQTGV